MMRALADDVLLNLWERGAACGPVERALLLPRRGAGAGLAGIARSRRGAHGRTRRRRRYPAAVRLRGVRQGVGRAPWRHRLCLGGDLRTRPPPARRGALARRALRLERAAGSVDERRAARCLSATVLRVSGHLRWLATQALGQ